METRKKVAQDFAEGKKKGKGSHIFIDGDTIYSYGYHFPIATRTGEKEAQFNESKYSRTTSAQQSAVRAALLEHGFKLKKMRRL